MSKKYQVVVVAFVVLALTAFLGCALFQDAITPCFVSEKAAEYAETETKLIMPYTTVLDARRVQAKMGFVHLRKQVLDDLNFEFLRGVNTFHISAAEELQQAIFSPTGIGALFPGIGGTVLGGFLIKRPKDKKKIAELEKANGKNKANS